MLTIVDPKMSNIQSQISNIQSALQAAYPADEANALAWWIAEELTGLSRTELQFGCKGTNFSSHMQEIETIIDRLLHFEPIQYIFGHTLWNGLDLKVTPSTLIPRPETAELVERINLKSEILNLKSQIHVLDVGTGSGCIAIALKKVHPEWSVTGIDISPEAIEVAKENARRNNVEINFQVADIFSDQMTKYLNKWYMVNDQMVNVLDIGTGSGCIAISLKKAHPEWHVTGIDISPNAIEVAKENARRNKVDVNFQVADIFSDQITKYKWYMVNDQMVNIVVSNPPYICESEKSSMRPNVLNFEPSTALFVPDNDPLLFYRRIAELFARTPYTIHHTPKYLFFEINEAYGPQLSAILGGLGYTDIQIHKDIYGKDRIIEGRMAR